MRLWSFKMERHRCTSCGMQQDPNRVRGDTYCLFQCLHAVATATTTATTATAAAGCMYLSFSSVAAAILSPAAYGSAAAAAAAAAAPSHQEALMQQMMQSPLMQHLLDDTEFVRSLVQSSPHLQALREQNPDINGLLSDPQVNPTKPFITV